MRSFRVMLVDDDELFFKVFESALSESSPDVELEWLSRGEDLLPTLLERPNTERPSLVMIDQRMPGCRGVDIVTAVRAHEATRATVTCLMSNSDSKDLVNEAYAAGANFFLCKPLRFDDLKRRAQALVALCKDVIEMPSA